MMQGVDAAGTARDVDPKLLEATVSVLAEAGWDGLRLERVAEEAGLSRVTLWRQGITRDALLQGLLSRLADDYRATMWPVLTSPGSGRDRLAAALQALCEVIDRNLALLLTSDAVFHRAPIASVEPFARLLRDGTADGSLQPVDRIEDVAEALFNTVCWSYVHLRGRHHWARDRARRRILELVLSGVDRRDDARGR
jgi:AcrR family transcriptional regulator